MDTNPPSDPAEYVKWALNKSGCGYQVLAMTFCSAAWFYTSAQTYWTSFLNDQVIEEFFADNDSLYTWTGTAFWLGYMAGVAATAYVSDKFGRMKTTMVSLFIMMGGAALCTYATSGVMYAAGRITIGVGIGGFGLSAFTWGTESLGDSVRPGMMFMPNLFFVLGACFLAPAGTYWFPEWRQYYGCGILVGVPYLLYPCILYESPLWLALKGKRDECQAFVHRLDPSLEPMPAAKVDEEAVVEAGAVGGGAASSGVLMRAAATCFMWASVSLGYYGVGMTTPDIGIKDDVWNWIYGFSVELPAYAAAPFVVETCLGRKWSVSFAYIIGGFCLLALLKLEAGTTPYITCYFVGRAGIAYAFASIYVWFSELFPTETRQRFMALASLFGRCASMGSPWVAKVSDSGHFNLAMAIVAVPCVISGLIGLLFLPETRGKAMD